MSYDLPVYYPDLEWQERRAVREQYTQEQEGKCMHCRGPLDAPAPSHITQKKIDWRKFPKNFLKHPIHLQHNHDTGMTEGAVHNYCNAVLWQYHGR